MECRVQRVTLTGGEPTIHPDFFEVVRAFRAAGMDVGVCTNATQLDSAGIATLAAIGGVHCNVSLDRFSAESHGTDKLLPQELPHLADTIIRGDIPRTAAPARLTPTPLAAGARLPCLTLDNPARTCAMTYWWCGRRKEGRRCRSHVGNCWPGLSIGALGGAVADQIDHLLGPLDLGGGAADDSLAAFEPAFAGISTAARSLPTARLIDGRRPGGAAGPAARRAPASRRGGYAVMQARYAESQSWLCEEASDPSGALYWVDRAVQWAATARWEPMVGYTFVRRSMLVINFTGDGLRAVDAAAPMLDMPDAVLGVVSGRGETTCPREVRTLSVSLPHGSFGAGLPTSARAAMLALGSVRDYAPGTVLLREGEQSSHVLVLVKGLVKVTATSPEGHLSLLAIRTAGDLVGELASMDNEPRIATVTAAGRVRARVVGQPEFRRYLVAHPDVALAVGGSVGAKLRWATRRRIDFGAHEVPVRVARVLVELITTYGSDEGDVGVPLTQPELAALVGAAEPTVHRTLSHLRKEEIITTGYRRVVVRDRVRLEAIADGD